MSIVNQYLSLNWAILPLLPADRRPPFRWRDFQKTPPGKNEWAIWRHEYPVPPYGLAVLAGRPSGIVVVDVDDEETAARLHLKVPFQAPFVKTRRGYHFYFRTSPENGVIPTTTVEIPEIGRLEIKGEGSLVPLPPSRHPKAKNKAYKWIIAPWQVEEIPPLPDFISKALEEKKRQRELTRQVGRVSFPHQGRKLSQEALREILAEVRAEVVKEVPLSGGLAWRLRHCPVCGKSEGNPWVLPSTGRLFDFRATCSASRDHGGLSLRAWLRGLGREDLLENLEVEELEEPSPPEVPVASVEEARSLILAALRRGGDLIITVPPGVGKSRTTLEWVCKEGPRPAVYSVPTIALAQELAKAARDLTADPVLVFTGRNKETCLRWEEARAAHELGYDPGQVLCPGCPHNPESAVFSKKCEFMRQFEGVNKGKGLFFASHKLACHLIKAFLKKAQVWIFDEEPYDLIEAVKCPLDALRTLRVVFPENSATMRLAEAVLKLGDELHRAANGKTRAEGRIYAREVEFGPWKGKKPLTQWLDLDLTQLAPVIRGELAQVLKTYRKPMLFREGVNLKALKWIEEVAGQGLAYLVARKDPERPIELRRVVNLIPDRWCGRLVVLDATAYPPVVEQALRRPGMQVLDVRVPMEVRTTWIKRSVSKTAIMQDKGRKTAIKTLNEALKAIKSYKILVFCHQAIKPEVEESVAQDDRKIVVTHHFGTETRGTNRFADFKGVILLGLPVPNPGAYYDAALALGLNSEEWEAWLDLLARAEAWQEVHRIRPILSHGRQVLVIAPQWPFLEWLGEPQELIEPEEIKGALDLASRVLLVWIEVFGFVFIEVALLLGIGRREQVPSPEHRARVWNKVQEVFPEKVERFSREVETLYKGTGNPLICHRNSLGFPQGKESKGFPPPFKEYIKGTGNPLAQEQTGSLGNFKGFPPPFKGICFTNRKWWPKLLARLRKARPELPVFEVAIRTPGGLQRPRGLGDIEAGKAFCKAIGLEINDNAWRYLDA